MKITFIMPCVGKKEGVPYVQSWRMEPLAIAVLNALTPKHIERTFFDDRMDEIRYSEATDLVAITVETYTAKRAYQIAARYRAKNIPVVMGGFHATLMPEEVETYCDSIVIGCAENVWGEVCADACRGMVRKRYQSSSNSFLRLLPDRSIYRNRNYGKISLVETGRGCRHSCEFCSVSSFFKARYYPRPIEDVVEEIRSLPQKNVFFIDDNFVADMQRAQELMHALIPLKIRWVGQVSIAAAHDRELLRLMKRSGCAGVLIGFESLEEKNLCRMHKSINLHAGDYRNCVAALRRCGLAVYGTFVFGYDNDTEEVFRKTLRFAVRNKLFFAAFNHLVPFPGTPLYARLKKQGVLRYDRWWLEDGYRFGDIAFHPAAIEAKRLEMLCLKYRKKFYGLRSIAYRACDFKANCSSFLMALVFLVQNLISRMDVSRRQGLPLGDNREHGGGE